jgi:hypothetical protein
MSSKKNPSTSRLFILKLCAFVICIFCVVIYDSLPEQIVTLYPNETTTLSIFSDESIGGNSQVLWIDQANSKYQCTVPDTTLSQYCGASITWWYEDGPKTYDLRGFQRLILDITYQGSTPNLVVNLYNTLQPIEGII